MYSNARGKSCRFKLEDVICPERERVLLQVTPDLEVEGEILFLSDEGRKPDRFAIIEVAGILSPLIVPVDCMKTRAGEGTKNNFAAVHLTPR
jgi:hypothetical protein